MLVNGFADALIGAVPVAGNIADVFWRANERNLALLERHARPDAQPAPSDYLAAGVLAAVFGLAVLVPVFLAVWLAAGFWWWLVAVV
jgi:hypothetical protein